MPRPIRAKIHLDALRHNLGVARRHAGSASVWSVIKANAYGHGLERVAQALADRADGFAVLDFEEAARLRALGLRQPILMLEGVFSAVDVALLAQMRLTPVIHSLDQIELLASAALPVRVPVYVKINTGMNRLGVAPEDLVRVLESLGEVRHVGEITLMTHFADADTDRGIEEQFARFRAAAAGRGLPASIANSATLLRFPEALGDWVRPGIMLYGGSPFPQRQSAAQLGLRPAMTLASTVIAEQRLLPGDRVGYGGSFVADAPMRIGIVACGYADGYPRHAPSGTPVLVAGERTRLVGRVSMDMLAADLTGIEPARIGSPAILWGEGLPADEVAAAAGTVSYELFCALAARVPIELH